MPGLPLLVAAVAKKEDATLDPNYVAKLLNQRSMSSLRHLWPLQRILKYLGRTRPELKESSLIDDVNVWI